MSTLRGINLGGWLVAERWMSPELFNGVKGEGERAISRELGDIDAQQRLQSHRASFITEADFKAIKVAGFDFVRLPVGYWLFSDAKDFISGEKYVDLAFEWAKQYGVGVVLDFHGLQGSQNGLDHSGQTGRTRFYYPWHRARALKTLEYLVDRYGNQSALIAVEIINEPKMPFLKTNLLRYYDKAYSIVRSKISAHVKIIVSDAYQPLKLAKLLSKRCYGDQLVLDIHLYQVFNQNEKDMTLREHVLKVENVWKPLITEIKQYVPNILVGEWSAALPAKAYRSLDGGETEHVAEYYLLQRQLFDETVWAHSYWSYRADGVGAWGWSSYRHFLND